MKVILASASPRRKALLQLVVPEFEVMVSQKEEVLQTGLSIEEQVMQLSYGKARDVWERTQGDRVIIGSDTVVTKNGRIYGKPSDRADAKRMIQELLEGDRTHRIVTGLSVLVEKEGEYQEYTTFDEVTVYLKEMSEQEIDTWIDTGKAMDKAGAYGIQEEFGVFVEKIVGNYTTVVGLPIHKVYDVVKKFLNMQKEY